MALRLPTVRLHISSSRFDLNCLEWDPGYVTCIYFYPTVYLCTSKKEIRCGALVDQTTHRGTNQSFDLKKSSSYCRRIDIQTARCTKIRIPTKKRQHILELWWIHPGGPLESRSVKRATTIRRCLYGEARRGCRATRICNSCFIRATKDSYFPTRGPVFFLLSSVWHNADEAARGQLGRRGGISFCQLVYGRLAGMGAFFCDWGGFVVTLPALDFYSRVTLLPLLVVRYCLFMRTSGSDEYIAWSIFFFEKAIVLAISYWSLVRLLSKWHWSMSENPDLGSWLRKARKIKNSADRIMTLHISEKWKHVWERVINVPETGRDRPPAHHGIETTFFEKIRLFRSIDRSSWLNDAWFFVERDPTIDQQYS